jgi:predicted AAA+ superfamily ATPase
MERLAMAQLRAWRTAPNRKPLILQGARQVGKTWLLSQFGAEDYQSVAYVDFEASPTVGRLFDGDLDIPTVVAGLRLATGVDIQPGKTLIVFDEVQACPRALTALKYFHDQANDYHVVCAGSLLGVALHQGTSFPVGKVTFLQVNPLTLAEFLQATGQGRFVEPLAAHDWTLLAPFHDRLVGLLRDYLFVGGMPEAVAAFAQGQNHAAARAVQLDILEAYDRDFSKHAPAGQVPRIRAVWGSIPGQLAKEHRRFAYGPVAQGARSRTHGAAIDWLVQAGVAVASKRVSAPRLPLSGAVDPAAFKLFVVDVGLLGALSALPSATVIEGDRLFTEFRGALVEQYAAMEFRSTLGAALHYWTNGGGTAEVDFLIQRDHDVVPVEVKAGRNPKSQSLRVYREKYNPGLSVRSSLAPYARTEHLVDLPLYALAGLPTL